MASMTIDFFLEKHPEVEIGRTSLDKLQATYSGDDTFSIVNKPFPNMVLYQEFNADTKERLYVVALIDDQEALKYYSGTNSAESEGASKCDCAEHHGPDHLIFDRMVVYKEAKCAEHDYSEDPDPDCSACWPQFCGGNCKA